MSDKLKQINEEGEGGAVGTTTSSVLGTPGSPTYGGYIGPLGRISRRQLGTRLFSTWGENGVKNSTGVGKVVQPPQGYLKEHIYSLEGKMVTEQDLNEWFGADLSKKPSWNGGKLVTIEPKCLAFPYCSQGSVDNPVKLIGENKDGMCQHCYEYVSYIAKETKKTPETIAKIIREKYLSNMEPLDESIELYNQSDNNIEENKLKGGKGDNLKKSDVNRKEFNMGMEIEKEHTKNTEARKEIVLDHLAEDPKYYTHLKSMEKKNNIKETKINMEKPIIITKQTIIEMVTPKTSSVNEMRSAMQAMMENEETANCLYEVLSMEGFLPNDLSEGEDYGTHCSTLMEDDDILSEMYKSCIGNTSECGAKLAEYNNPNINSFVNALDEIGDETMVDEPIAAVPETSAVPAYIAKQRRILDQEVAKYSVMNKHFANYVDRLDPVDINDYFHRELNGNEYSSEGFKDFLIKKEGESSIEYFDRINYGDGYAAVLKNLVEPRKRGFFLKYGKKIGVQAQDEMEDLLSDIFDLKNMIYIKRMEVEKLNQGLEGKAAKADVANDVYIDPEKPDQVPDLVGKKQATSIPTDTSLDIDDVEDDEFLQESNLPEFTPIKGKNVDSENKKESKSATSEEGEEAEESQETIDQKVDNLKNQKYELNKTEDGTAEKLHGWRNNLDLDYKNGLTDDQKKRFEDQASGMAPKDHANVDHDSTGGEKLIKAAKARTEGGENSINQSDYTSRVDRTNIEKKSEYEKTGVFNESIERMKKLFDYEANEISQNKTNKDKDENDVLFESVKTKKFI